MIAPEAGLSVTGNARCSRSRAASITGPGRSVRRNSSFWSGSTGFHRSSRLRQPALQVALSREGFRSAVAHRRL